MYQRPNQFNNRGCLQMLRDQIWGFVFGLAGTILMLASLVVAIIALPPLSSVRQSISQTISATPAPTDTPTATPSPTATPTPVPHPRVINKNITIACIDVSCTNNTTLVLDTITIDFAKKIMVLKFTATTTEAGYIGFRSLSLQNVDTVSDVTYTANGPAMDESQSVTAYQPLDMLAVFAFLPQPNVRYRMKTQFCEPGTCPYFQDTYLTFTSGDVTP
jgi:hypothetical protein